MVVAVFGCLFGILGIFTLGIVFVPLAALCAVFGLCNALLNQKTATGLLSVMAGILAVAGFVLSPSLWLASALLLAPIHGGSTAPVRASDLLRQDGRPHAP